MEGFMSWRDKQIYFIGIGGIGMSGIAKMLIAEHATVSGSDIRDSAKLEELRRLGATVILGHAAENVPRDVDQVVMTAAIKPNNEELREAHKRGIKVLKYAEMLGILMRQRKGIAVSGTHGKTTTTAMISSVLVRAGLDPTFVIGGDVEALGGSSRVGNGIWFVAEACEYDRSFHNLRPDIAVITSIEEDHLDYYRDLKEITQSFARFASLVPTDGVVIANNQDRNVRAAIEGLECDVQTYGIRVESDWMASEPAWDGSLSHFQAFYRGDMFGEFALQQSGVHNVLNALAAIAVCTRAGVSVDDIREGLASFQGVLRRFELIGEARGIVIIDDYAHHPTEIQVTLKAARERFDGRRIWCVFQPHQHSRTRFLLKDFARSFGSADRILVPDIYFVRDSEEDRTAVTSMDLVGEISNFGGDALYLADFDNIEEHLLENLVEGDVLITMGAGNVDEVARRVLARLSEQPQARASG